MSIQSILNSHNAWFDLLSYTKLNELFQRASFDQVNRRVLLKDHITRQLPPDSKYYIIINLEEQYILPNKTKDICSIYINIFDKQTRNKVAHFTLHFFKDKEMKNQSTGRIHFKNNKTQRSHVIRINKNNNEHINMTITYYPDKPSESLYKIYSIITNIMYQYTTYGNPLFLGEPLTSMSSTEHKCINLTEQEWKTSKTPLRHTRKRNYKSKNPIRRNKKSLS